MRGRTFLNKFVIIDEAQNLTPKQMKTLITRAGPGTKMVCLGNLAQIDTPYLTEGSSGLTYARSTASRAGRTAGRPHRCCWRWRHAAARRALAAMAVVSLAAAGALAGWTSRVPRLAALLREESARHWQDLAALPLRPRRWAQALQGLALMPPLLGLLAWAGSGATWRVAVLAAFVSAVLMATACWAWLPVQSDKDAWVRGVGMSVLLVVLGTESLR
jgi:hypothetical protein